MKIAIFHDYIGAIGGGEKLILTLARGLGADVITTDVDEDSVRKMGFLDVRIISIGGTIKMPPLKQIYSLQATLFSGGLNPVLRRRCDALKNISFTVKKGEAVGIIGENGSGKSTLLKILANILRPGRGSVRINGKITPFLELGVGFQPDLTAKENIYIYGAIMGLLDRGFVRRHCFLGMGSRWRKAFERYILHKSKT